MKNTIVLISLSLIIFSCSEKNESQEQNETQVQKGKVIIEESSTDSIINKTDKETVVIPEKIQNSTDSKHIFRKGETLWGLGRTYYGNRHYSSLIKIYNNIENSSTIKEGTLIKVPPLNEMLSDPDLGLDTIIGDEIDKSLTALSLIEQHKQTLKEQRDSIGYGIKLFAPSDVRKDFEKASKLINEIIISLKQVKNDTIKAPENMINYLKRSDKFIKKMTDKYVDENMKDLDMVQQHFINAFYYAIKWAGTGYK